MNPENGLLAAIEFELGCLARLIDSGSQLGNRVVAFVLPSL